MQNREIKIDEFKWDMNDVIGSANDTNALRNNEFYTRMKEIEDEMKHYKRHFKNKVSYCNCDDPTQSIFYQYFYQKFDCYGLKELITT